MKISSMGTSFKSLVVLSLLLISYIATAAARPHTVSRYNLYKPSPPGNGSTGTGQVIPRTPETRRSSKTKQGLPGFRFGFFHPWESKSPPENKQAGGGEEDGEKGPIPNLGYWKIDSENAGVAAMQIQLMPKRNKIVWLDSTSNGLSEIELNPGSCKPRWGGRENDPPEDCTAHAIEYDIETAEIRTLKVETSPWCSSGGLNKNGDLISTGGDQDGLKSIRILKGCPNCDFQENPRGLFSNRWYATQHALEDGSFVVIGGRSSFNYEIIPADTLDFTPKQIELPLLAETDDDGGRENNLYPFVNLLPDGNLFVFANYKSIILNPYTGETVRNLPDLPGGSRNYPPSEMSALLPINLNINEGDEPEVEVLICGGNTRESYTLSDLQQPKRTFLPAAKDCGRLKLNREDANWEKEDMPSPRVMGDMLLLPTGDVLMINGAKAGTSAWNAAKDPNLTPVLYSPNKKEGKRFQELTPSGIPRMYHSVSAVLPDGQVIVAGSNTNPYYMLDKYGDQYASFPTELRVEKFLPPYLAEGLQKYRLEILEGFSDQELVYGGEFNIEVQSKEVEIDEKYIKVTMYSPPFTTHGYSMNQRLLILKMKRIHRGQITVVAPPSGTLAPPGYYLVFVVHRDIPSRGMWVHIN
ncbi:Galactose oxidase [Handroanthus impetiginosus]|uniref:Galactose oxidase n=1 Tax=Handroanthus impetiginosus TaxID=429701 RepID=A0A2G9G6L0_9LAMI|nr:Galactose oxidase [Handroanthus impetiginosus]